MRLLILFAILAILTISTQAQLEKGIKGSIEDVVLVGADDWHGPIAATPLSIWSENNNTIKRPLLILPKDVQSGKRLGWVTQEDLDRYGATSILQTMEAGNITAIVAHGSGDSVKGLIEMAHKDGLKVYVTATLEIPVSNEPKVEDISFPTRSDNVTTTAKYAFLGEIGLSKTNLNKSKAYTDRLQKLSNQINGSYFCPVNPNAREDLYNRMEQLVTEYKVDGVVLYNFGFQDENYCYCDFCKEAFYKDTGIDLTKVSSSSYNL